MSSSSDITPIQAVMAAADHPISGTFLMEVKATGASDGHFYVNSEADYRDQRCLTVEMPDSVADELRIKLGRDLSAGLVGKKIRITGTAEKVRIAFTINGVPTDKYYFQTHVIVTRAAQIVVL